MDAILKLIGNMNTFLWSYILIVMLITLGLYFTFLLFEVIFSLILKHRRNKQVLEQVL